jgi:hypothetical protein
MKPKDRITGCKKGRNYLQYDGHRISAGIMRTFAAIIESPKDSFNSPRSQVELGNEEHVFFSSRR